MQQEAKGSRGVENLLTWPELFQGPPGDCQVSNLGFYIHPGPNSYKDLNNDWQINGSRVPKFIDLAANPKLFQTSRGDCQVSELRLTHPAL
jgi:hypothetical protein